MLKTLLNSSRYLVLLAVLGALASAIALFVYGIVDADVKVASRLHIHTFDDLKTNLVSVVIAVMAVTFLGNIISWDGETQLLGIGVAVALVIGALNFYLWIVKGGKK